MVALPRAFSAYRDEEIGADSMRLLIGAGSLNLSAPQAPSFPVKEILRFFLRGNCIFVGPTAFMRGGPPVRGGGTAAAPPEKRRIFFTAKLDTVEGK